MPEKYDQQDGSPNPRPDTDTASEETGHERTATVGERSTQENMSGQGLGQTRGDEAQRGDS